MSFSDEQNKANANILHVLFFFFKSILVFLQDPCSFKYNIKYKQLIYTVS